MSDLIRKAIEAAVDGALGEVARQAGPSRMLAEARSAGLLAAEPFALALSAPPPDLAEIERLVSALVDKAWWCAHASSFDIDAATADCKAARAALLAAIRSQVPADLRATLIDLADDLLDVPIGGPASPTVARIRAVAARLREVATSLPAKKVQVPADLAGLLREHLAACEAWLSGVDDGDSLRFSRSQKALADWTRANLKETP